MHSAKALLTLLICAGAACPILACTCVSALDPAKSETSDQMSMRVSSVVFRGLVIGKRKLSSPDRIHGSIYAVTYRVDEYWKGSPTRELIVYGMADVFPGRCEGWGEVSVGKEYLIYAFESEVQSESSADRNWIEYADVIQKGTKIMTVGACTPSRQVSSTDDKTVLRELGPSMRPKQSN